MTDGTQHTLVFSVPHDHPSFVGHFPGNPLAPGALLLRWMIEQLQQINISIYLIKQCKFLHIVRPGDELRLDVSAANGSVTVTMSCADTPVAKAQCLYHVVDPDHER